MYGFERTPGMLNRGRIHVEMDPEQLRQQRERVLTIRKQLEEFQYGMY